MVSQFHYLTAFLRQIAYTFKYLLYKIYDEIININIIIYKVRLIGLNFKHQHRFTFFVFFKNTRLNKSNLF